MKNVERHPFPAALARVERAFVRLLPRRCTPEWLELLTGPARFGWDVDAVQRGFIDPLYELFEARPERWRPTLAALLMEAGGRDPEQYPAMLAAVELQYLASVMLENIRNGRNIAEAMPTDTGLPLPVAVTVAYTARQLASTLIICHEAALPRATRSWLAYQMSRALYETSAGAAVDIHCAAKGVPPVGDWHLRLVLTPLSFRLPIDCALAALERHEAPEAKPLRDAAARAGIAYRLAMDVLGRRARAREELPTVPYEPTIQWSSLAPQPGETPSVTWQRLVRSGRGAHVLSLARHERQTAREALVAADGPLAGMLRTFLEAVVDVRLVEAEEVIHAE